VVDHTTGLAVPVLAVTIHPDTGLVLPLGGTCESEITNLITPIEKYLIFPKSGAEYGLVKCVAFDSTGRIVPEFFDSIECSGADFGIDAVFRRNGASV